MWFVYVLVSRAGRTYVGVTTDLERRVQQHNGALPGGARATRAHRPWEIGRVEGPVKTRGRALALEYRLKQSRGRARLTVVLRLPIRGASRRLRRQPRGDQDRDPAGPHER